MPFSVMNDTKWDELRLAMDSLHQAPSWSTLSTNGYQSHPDGEWFYHFREGGYEDILHVDIMAEDADHRALIRSALREVHVPGEETEQGFRIYGYLQDGQAVDYL